MRYVYMVLIATFVAIIALFKVQNLDTVSVELLGASFTLRVSVLILLIYVLGALTDGALKAHMSTWVHGATRRA